MGEKGSKILKDHIKNRMVEQFLLTIAQNSAKVHSQLTTLVTFSVQPQISHQKDSQHLNTQPPTLLTTNLAARKNNAFKLYNNSQKIYIKKCFQQR